MRTQPPDPLAATESRAVKTERDGSKTGRYVVITPVRNEEEYLPYTLKSMMSQTVKPLKWIIVNDGSTDRTGEIAEEAARFLD
jgi:cellulose synthase/poly-beta-1,6-N-acetylglucosamine synthase-like glycosyltransferase